MKLTNKKGFTIVELVIVIAVVAILAAVLIPTFANLINKANISADQQLIANINKALSTDEILNSKPETLSTVKNALVENGIKADVEATAKDMIFVYDYASNRVLYVNESTKECTYPKAEAGAYDNTKQWMRLNPKYVSFSNANSAEWNSTFLPTYQLSDNITLTADVVIQANQYGNYHLDLNGYTISGEHSLTLKSDYAGYVLFSNGTMDVANYIVEMPNAHVVHDSSLIVDATNSTITTSSTSYVLSGSLEVESTLTISGTTKLVKDSTANLKFDNATVAETASVFVVDNAGASQKVENDSLASIKTLHAAQVGETPYEDIYEALKAVNNATTNVELKLLSNVNLGTKAFTTTIDAGTLVFDNNSNVEITVNLNGFNITGTTNTTSGNDALICVKKGTVKFVDNTANPGSVIYSARVNRSWNNCSNVIDLTGNTNVPIKVEIEGGNYIHNGGTDMAYVFDVSSTACDVTLIVNGGNLKCTYRAIRGYADSTSYTVNINIKGGSITSTGSNCIWIQSPNTNSNLGSLSISGGTFSPKINVKPIYVWYPADSVDENKKITVSITGGTVVDGENEVALDRNTHVKNA